MYRRQIVVTILVLLLSLAFASVSFAQTGTGSEGNQQGQNQGNSPASAFTSAGQGRALAQGQRHWYAFQYAGDESQIQIRLRNAANMMFSVWSQQDIQNAGGDFGTTATPVGRSTANEDQFDGDQYWTGSFSTPGTYYVLVERMQGANNDNAGGNYSLEITGSGVSFGGQGQTGTQQGQTGTQQGQAGTQQGSLAPSTLPQTGGQAPSALPLLIGGMGALSVAAGVLLRRKK